MYWQAKSKIVSWKTCWKSKSFNTVEPRLTATLVIWSPRFTAPFLATWQNGHTFLVKKKTLVNADYFLWPIVDRINEVALYNKKTTNNIRDCKPIWTVLIKQWYNNGATVNPLLTPFKAGLKEMGGGGEGGGLSPQAVEGDEFSREGKSSFDSATSSIPGITLQTYQLLGLVWPTSCILLKQLSLSPSWPLSQLPIWPSTSWAIDNNC